MVQHLENGTSVWYDEEKNVTVFFSCREVLVSTSEGIVTYDVTGKEWKVMMNTLTSSFRNSAENKAEAWKGYAFSILESPDGRSIVKHTLAFEKAYLTGELEIVNSEIRKLERSRRAIMRRLEKL